ncbi:MAG: hypothetical protein AAGA00_07335 [Pseudomonadota bacterium]
MAKKPVSNPSAADTAAFVKTCPNGPSVFQQASHFENRFMVQIPDGDQLDDICKPSYWAHHAARVTPKSLLTCIDQRLRWEADLRVLEAGRNYLRVAVVRHVAYDVKALGRPEIERLRKLHAIESNGQNGWRVIDPDGVVLFAGLTTRVDAEWALDTHLGTMNRKAVA